MRSVSYIKCLFRMLLGLRFEKRRLGTRSDSLILICFLRQHFCWLLQLASLGLPTLHIFEWDTRADLRIYFLKFWL